MHTLSFLKKIQHPNQTWPEIGTCGSPCAGTSRRALAVGSGSVGACSHSLLTCDANNFGWAGVVTDRQNGARPLFCGTKAFCRPRRQWVVGARIPALVREACTQDKTGRCRPMSRSQCDLCLSSSPAAAPVAPFSFGDHKSVTLY